MSKESNSESNQGERPREETVMTLGHKTQSDVFHSIDPDFDKPETLCTIHNGSRTRDARIVLLAEVDDRRWCAKCESIEQAGEQKPGKAGEYEESPCPICGKPVKQVPAYMRSDDCGKDDS